MSQLLAFPILLPIAGAAVSTVVGRSLRAQRIVGVSVLTAVTVIAVVLAFAADDRGIVVTQSGGWEAPLGITLVLDRLSATLLAVASITLLAVLVYAIGHPGADNHHVGFQSVYLMLAAGVSMSFLTGDLFTLFVGFEVMLTASYVLITLGGTRQQVRSSMTYVVISLLASALFITALAFLYSATGTVNMADLSGRIADLPHGVRLAFATLLLVVFGVKAALFPLFFWLPDSYPTAPSPVTAVFAGLLTKVGVYALIRTQLLLFPADSRPTTLILVMAGATMLIGILGAIAQDDVKRILSFNIVSHIGSMVMGLGFFTIAGVAAAMAYTVHHIVAMTTLFLVSGLVEHVGGSSRLSRLGNMVRTAPPVAALFLVSALGLAGVPPLSGFVPKFGLVAAGFEGDATALQRTVVGISLLVSLLTLFSMMKIWIGAFWGPADDEPTDGPTGTPHVVGRIGGPVLMVLPTAGLLVVSLGFAAAMGPLYELCQRAAADLIDPQRYIDAVLP
jgi:multicomponent Na+:H+ antiporter subunit D